jgi:predicted ATP-grasp superfamily ATP-dependent carboligase
VLIPCTDAHVWTISAQRQAIAGWYHIALPDHDTLDLLIDKQRFLTFAQQTNLRIPETYFLESHEDAVRVSAQIRYPVVIKPPFRSAIWRENTKEKAFKVDDQQAFLDCFNRYKPLADTLIAQQWIFGDDTTLYSCNCYFNRDNQPLVTFTSRKLRQYPPRTGQSSLGEEIRADEVLDETIRLFQSVGYWGLGYLEMKRDDRSGEFFIVEPNIGRPTGRSAIAEAGGVDILYTMYCDLVGLPLPATRVQQYGKVKWMHLLRDLKSAYFYWRHGELTVAQWMQSMSGRKYDAVFSLTDPAPFISALISMLSPGGKL